MKKIFTGGTIVLIFFLFSTGGAQTVHAAKKVRLFAQLTETVPLQIFMPSPFASTTPEAPAATSTQTATPTPETIPQSAPADTSDPDPTPTQTPQPGQQTPATSTPQIEPEATSTPSQATSTPSIIERILPIIFPPAKPKPAPTATTSTTNEAATSTQLLPSLGIPPVVGSIYAPGYLTLRETQVLIALAATFTIAGILFAEGKTLDRITMFLRAPRAYRSRFRA